MTDRYDKLAEKIILQYNESESPRLAELIAAALRKAVVEETDQAIADTYADVARVADEMAALLENAKTDRMDEQAYIITTFARAIRSRAREVAE